MERRPQRKQDRLVSQASLTRELGCARSSISRLVRHGLPTTDDGLLYRDAALRWIECFTSGYGGGWPEGSSLADRAARARTSV